MAAPLFDRLNKLKTQNSYPFHMPGHKFNGGFLPDKLYSYDFTEISGTDNLHDADDVIFEAQRLTSELFGADNSFFMVNGGSGGIIAAVLSVCCPGDKIITARNCHKSVYSGLILSGALPVYVYPEFSEYGLAGGIDPEKIEALLKLYENDGRLKAVILTSPTYEGVCSDIGAISAIVHRYNKILIVDEAHGAHFKFSADFPAPALDLGADIVIQSLHKTLPALTQSAVLHTKGGRADIKRLGQMLSIIQTSSPSYIFMAVMDKMRENLSNNGPSIFERYTGLLKELRHDLSVQDTIRLLGRELKNNYAISDMDISKLVFHIQSDIDGKTLEKKLSDAYNFTLEYSTADMLLAMTSPADTSGGFKVLKNGILETSKQLRYIPSAKKAFEPYSASEIIIPIREAFYNETSEIHIDHACGRICGGEVTPYPPGIPLILPGEKITAQTIELIRSLIRHDINILGLSNQKIMVIKE